MSAGTPRKARAAWLITEPVPTGIQRLWDRPFAVWWGDFPGALRAEIRDPVVSRIADKWLAGGIDRIREFVPGRGHRDLLLQLFN